jgi:SAM-dependent methyltransferase
MNETSNAVARYYGSNGLGPRILAALAAEGLPTEGLSAEQLFSLDQLHGRGLAATKEHLAKLKLDANQHVLDVGSGIGGPARYMAVTYGCRVTGIDLTEEFVVAARELTRRCGLADRIAFHHGDALAMPFADASFDAATCQYVAMNIPDKAGLLKEIRRVLKPGGRLLWSAVVEGSGKPPNFPLPWARDPAVSFLVQPDALRLAFNAAGLRVLEWTDETEAVMAFIDRMRVAPPPPSRLSNAVALGDDFSDRMANFNSGFGDGRLRALCVVAQRA